ncbi:PREDICTED: NADH dehydrogenase [ubiquinone] 1 beta subcomplex subunit 4-like, partial [Galeopterus variegatus]|uniref:NADH dehydrogenase [ubiquinone] 1 beta subcomplex subunit 4 n=1 Tax=Galeopterus variegatus TaxID=482537 RepID=A0ABM0Q5N6_GALVR
EDPALIRWTYARSNIYPNFRPSPKTSLLGALWGIGPLFFWYYVLKTDRDKKEKLIQEGKLDRAFNLLY